MLLRPTVPADSRNEGLEGIAQYLCPHETLTRVNLEVCAVMAVKGDWSGSGTSMVKGRGRVVHKSRPPKRKREGKKQRK
jgi:hypothetical protein